ncbi:exosortase/archaeosortase family protein [Flavisolibacter sp. BT320]|nr:exosortase/archaeosortase family protein [Flavisolibacter longurius]
MLKTISEKTSKVMDVSFFAKYLIKFVAFYYIAKFCFYAWHAVSYGPGLIHIPFFEQYLNFYDFIKIYMFQLPSGLAEFFGVHAFQDTDQSLQVEGGQRLLVKRPCYGIGLMSFWAAFVLADATAWKRKLVWGVVGIASLLLINILRVTLMLIATKNQWNVHLLDSYGLDHHTQFNIVAYALIFLLMFFYYKRNKASLGRSKEGEAVAG